VTPLGTPTAPRRVVPHLCSHIPFSPFPPTLPHSQCRAPPFALLMFHPGQHHTPHPYLLAPPFSHLFPATFVLSYHYYSVLKLLFDCANLSIECSYPRTPRSSTTSWF
jgi:hypothetical protein